MKTSLKRKKALFGENVAAAGITVAGMLAAAGLQAAATKKAAEEQAKSIENQARSQEQALREYNNVANENVKSQQDFIRQENEKQIDYQKTAQQNLLMAMGQDQLSDRKRESMIQVKCGGRLSNRRRGLNGLQSSLRAGTNMPFIVTDGGGVQPMFTTPEGGDMYQIKGNTHEQYHKVGNTYKSGVGIKFADGNVIEGEGDGSSSKTLKNGGQLENGEGLYDIGEDVYFISQHGLPLNKNILSASGGLGIKNNKFVPMKAVKEGMHPLQAFNIQENIKNMYGISDSGKAKCGRSLKRLNGGIALDMNNGILQFNQDMLLNSNNFDALQFQNKMKCGGKKSLRTRAADGYWYTPQGANILGAIGSGIGNFGAAGINYFANRYGSRILGNAYNTAGERMAEAYRNLQGIDPNDINWESFRPDAMIAAIKTPHINVQPETTRVERSSARQRTLINRNNLSSAALQNRLQNIETNEADRMSTIYANQAAQEQKILNENVDILNDTQKANMQMRSQAGQSELANRIKIAEYNSGIKNQSILGEASSLNEGLMGATNARVQAIQNNASNFASALTGTMSSFANALTTNAKMRYDADQATQKYKQDFRNTWLGTDTSGKIDYIASNLDDPEVINIAHDLLNSLEPGSAQWNRLRKVLGFDYGNFDLTLQRARIDPNYASKLIPNIIPTLKFGGNISKHRSLKR